MTGLRADSGVDQPGAVGPRTAIPTSVTADPRESSTPHAHPHRTSFETAPVLGHAGDGRGRASVSGEVGVRRALPGRKIAQDEICDPHDEAEREVCRVGCRPRKLCRNEIREDAVSRRMGVFPYAVSVRSEHGRYRSSQSSEEHNRAVPPPARPPLPDRAIPHDGFWPFDISTTSFWSAASLASVFVVEAHLGGQIQTRRGSTPWGSVMFLGAEHHQNRAWS